MVNVKSILNKQKNLALDSSQVGQLGQRYREFCANYSLEQIIKSLSRITSTSTSLIDHIITNSSINVNNSGVIDTTLSDHQLIYCTRKLYRIKMNIHKSISCRSTKDYTSEALQHKLTTVNFPNYEIFDNVNEAYSDFSNKLSDVINKIAPFKEIRVKNSNQD